MRVKLSHIVSPASNAVLMAYGFLVLVFLLQPTPKEFLLFFVIDGISLALATALEWRFFRRKYPVAKYYFPELSVQELVAAPKERLKEIVDDLYKFPRRRVVFLTYGNILKVLPAFSFILVALSNGTVTSRLIRLGFFELTFFTAFAAISYFEIHAKVSEVLRAVYEGTPHKEALLQTGAADAGGSLLRVESAAHGMLFVLAMSFVSVQLLEPDAAIDGWYVARLVGVLLLGFLLHSRIFVLCRTVLFTGFTDVIRSMKGMELNQQSPLLPLHTSSELNAIERAFNSMSLRLRKSQAELVEWVEYESDQNRFRSLGEVAGLVVHDLGTPLHVMKYSVEELVRSNTITPDNPMRLRLERSLEKAASLVESLRAYLKDGHRSGGGVRFGEAHFYVLRVLSLEYAEKLDRVPLESVVRVDDAVVQLLVGCARLDLIQVLDNLYRNALQNMTDHHVPGPSIHVSIVATKDSFVTVSLADSGTGMTRETFEAMTSSQMGASGFKRGAAEKGLGLRLTRRLVEHLQGELKVSTETRERGTCMLLTLPLASANGEVASARKEA